MASLNKLAIRGIRSFDDKQISIIEFFSPVTVIVGHNGSGKTTIIECLKYVTTGDQPPNTRGGAFIHDPKMANEKEVKAQVKLRFHAANGTRMLAVRNLSVTVKKTGLTMKTLESILALADGNVEKGGKRGAISTKCAEMDAEIPHLLGVSKSVLENVIFCHQEESYWPLAEPSALKKKFDDIFEATRYTKALDSIKALRKDRVADLKADKERLESLSKEKAHADKLRTRISELQKTITAKEIQYERVKNEWSEMVDNNARFYESANKFRETYVKVENLQNRKEDLQRQLGELRETTKEVSGTEEELRTKAQNFDANIQAQRQKRSELDAERQDLEDDLSRARKTHVELITEHGELLGESRAQERRIAERTDLVRDISERHSIRGYQHGSLDKDKVAEFIEKLSQLQRSQRIEYEKIQSDLRTKNEEFNRKSRGLHAELEGFKLQRSNLRDQMKDRQSVINNSEVSIETMQTVSSDLLTLQGDIEDKKSRIERLKTDIRSSNFDEKMTEKASKARRLDDGRDFLNTELRGLSLQADVRAKLDLKRSELKSKNSEVKNLLEVCGPKYKKFAESDPQADGIEAEVDRLTREKERQLNDAEAGAAEATKALQQIDTSLENLKAQAEQKRREIKKGDEELKGAIPKGFKSLDDAIDECETCIREDTNKLKDLLGMKEAYEKILKLGEEKKTCHACTRHMDDSDLKVFRKHLAEQIKQSSEESTEKLKEGLEDYEDQLRTFKKWLPLQSNTDRIRKTELPLVDREIAEKERELPEASQRAEDAAAKLSELKKEMREMAALKQHAVNITRCNNEIKKLTSEVSNLEEDLATSGSKKTPDDVQAELDALSTEIRANDRERQTLTSERERYNNLLRTYENDLHAMEKQENTLSNQLREKDILEERIANAKREIAECSAKLKELDSKISEAQAPIQALEEENERIQGELNSKLKEAQDSSQELNMSVDKLDSIGRTIDRYIREKRDDTLAECAVKVEDFQSQIRELGIQIENKREEIAEIDREINESGSAMATLRDNLRIRKLVRDVTGTQAEIDKCDMEAAAKAKRNFEEKYQVEKEKETDLQSKFAHIGGEISSHKSQLQQWEDDFREYKDINKRYTDQLVKVKMSDMANSDLEKYAKALENAIMKYHTLKMEEVNDTMRHLWNKTYQGTDIDGIKIRSDVEGGASKRSYNYRVVMTKDQVEMDMRGRCSAGQKMLASIIIRLALSDSFGQNCGILALDEPTNALDVENIDALASSLVDIINERKNHSNFQLIIITHDENFLRRLGQAEVMEYYWRVSRDARQKSIIERQRFR